MKSVIKVGILLAAVGAAWWWFRGSGGRPGADGGENFSSGDTGKEKTVGGRNSILAFREPQQSSSENQSEKNPSVVIPPGVLKRPVARPSRKYDEEYMREFLGERREMDSLESVSIGRGTYHISKGHKAVVLPETEGRGYYRVGAWTVVPLDYREEDEGYPILFNRSDGTISVLTGLVTVKLAEDVSLEKGREMLVEKGLEVDAITEHLNIIHAKFFPVTGQSLRKHEKTLEEMGIFVRMEFEIDRGGPRMN